MNVDYGKLARSAKRISGEKRFVIDWAYRIKKPTKCEMCGDVVFGGVFTRAWFEISRRVYPNCIGGNRKGITFCNKHTRKAVGEYLVHFFNDKVASDVMLKNCKTWSVCNAYEQHGVGLLKNIVGKDLKGFRVFVLGINNRYKCGEEKLNVSRKVVDEIEKQYESLISDREFRNITDNELKRRLEDIDDMLSSTVRKNNRKKDTSSVENWKKRVGEYIQDLAVSRFLYNGEISNSSYFRKRLLKYAGKWNAKNFLALREEVRKEAKKRDKKNSLKHKIKIVDALTKTLQSGIEKLSCLLDEIKGMTEDGDA